MAVKQMELLHSTRAVIVWAESEHVNILHLPSARTNREQCAWPLSELCILPRKDVTGDTLDTINCFSSHAYCDGIVKKK